MKALVIGGTGPSGPYIVNGLLERGYEVTILHGGQHEVEFAQPVEHIHTDPHFAETLAPALEGRSFDIVLATYGRMRIIAELLKGKTGRFIGAGGAGVYAHHEDPRWGPLGPPTMVAEDAPRCDDPSGPKFNHLMWVTEETVMRAHREGHYSATYFRYPSLYGAHAPANPDWSIVRRILDGRKRLIVPANGVLKRRGYARNVAHALLLAVDKPAESSGQIYNIRDEHQYTQRQYVEFIARHLRHDCEIVEVPPALAQRVYKGGAARRATGCIEYDISKIRTQLGYRDLIAARAGACRRGRLAGGESPGARGRNRAAARRSVRLRRGRRDARGLMQGYAAADSGRFPDVASGHMYRHPKKPGEAWAPPANV